MFFACSSKGMSIMFPLNVKAPCNREGVETQTSFDKDWEMHKLNGKTTHLSRALMFFEGLNQLHRPLNFVAAWGKCFLNNRDL